MRVHNRVFLLLLLLSWCSLRSNFRQPLPISKGHGLSISISCVHLFLELRGLLSIPFLSLLYIFETFFRVFFPSLQLSNVLATN